MTRLLNRGRRGPSDKHRSPSETIELSDGVRLHHLDAAPGDQYPVPIVLVPSLLSKYQVFDIHPARSMAGFLRDHQFDVWIVDWGKPRRKRPTPGFESYVDDWLDEAVGTIVSHGDTGQVSMLGYSLGGVISTLYAASYPESVRNLITLTTPINFHRTGLTATWARYFPVDAFVDFWGNVPSWCWLDRRWFDVNKMVDGTGNLSADVIANGGKMLKAVANYVGAYVNLWDRMEDGEGVRNWQAMHRWVHDGVPFPGAAFRQWVEDYLWGNALVTGKHVVRGRPVRLADIEVPILNVLAKHDHIVPNAQSLPVADLVGSTDVTTEILQAGHIGIMAGRSAHDVLWPTLAAWLGARSGGA